jgi:hypothetical protein
MVNSTQACNIYYLKCLQQKFMRCTRKQEIIIHTLGKNGIHKLFEQANQMLVLREKKFQNCHLKYPHRTKGRRF